MRKIYTTIAILLCLGSSIAFAQNISFSITPADNTVEVGETFTIDFTVEDGFDEIPAMEFWINWDTDVLEYVSKSNATTELPGFSEMSVADADGFLAQGYVKISWIDLATFLPHSLDDGTRLFSLSFMGRAAGASDFFLSNIEIGDPSDPVDATLNDNTTTVGDGSGGLEQNEDPLGVGIGDGNGSTGDQICLPVRVSNFENMQTVQFSMAYDESLLAFQAAQNLNLNNLTAANIANPAAGELTFSWNVNGDSITVSDNTRIFDICFDVLGTENTSTDVSIEDTPLSIEAMRASVGEVGITESDGTVTISADNGGGGTSENFRIYGEELSAAPGETICMDIKVDGFADVLGMQYSMSWNTDVINLTELRNFNSAVTGLNDQNFNVQDGVLRIQWNDFASADGITLPDETTVYQMCFELVGVAGQSSLVSFTNTPIGQEVLDKDDNIIPFTGVDGRINIAGDPPPPSDCDENATPFCLSDEMADIGQNVCVRVNAQNFTDIASMQFTITYDESIIRFDTIRSLVDGDFVAGIVYNANDAAGIISFQWSNVNAANLSFPDGTALFDFCFEGEAVGISSVGFSGVPTAIEVGDIDFNIKEFNPGTGEIEVKGDITCSAPNVSGDVTNVLCTGEASGAIGLSVVGGNDNFTYEWSGPTPIPDNSPSGTELAAGEYNVTVTSGAEGCDLSTDMTFTISEPAEALTASAEVTGEVICFGDDNGSITISVEGGTGDYSYEWQRNITDGNSADNLPAGDYGIRVSDDNGCSVDVNVTVEGPTEELEITTDISNVSCEGENTGAISTTITGGTPEYTYAWEGEGVESTAPNQTGLAAGNYNLTVTDANNCDVISTAIEVLPFEGEAFSINAPAINNIVSGDDGAIDIDIEGGSGEFTFLWEGPEGSGFTSEEEDITGLGNAGVYFVTITDINTGCEITESYELQEQTDVAFGLITTTPDCSNEGTSNGTISVEVNGGVSPLTFSWGETDLGNTPNPTNVPAGEYVLTVTDANGNTFMTESISVGTSTAIEYSLTATAETCSEVTDNGSVTLTASGGTGALSWIWSNETADVDSLGGLDSGTYGITITDEAGCRIIDAVEVEFRPDEPRAMEYDITEATCGNTDGAIAFTVACGDPNYVVTIQGRSPENDSMYMFRFEDYNPRVVLSDLAPDTYDVTITDANEFSTPDVITVPAPGNISVVENVFSSTEIFEPCDGEIRLTNTGGGSAAGFTYEWSNGANTKDIDDLCEGAYIVTITNEEGCTMIDTFLVETLNADGVVQQPACGSGDFTGAIDLTVRSGQGPFTYIWERSESDFRDTIEDLSNIEAGLYVVTITEASGVSITRIFDIKGGSSDLVVDMAFGENYQGFGVSCNGATDGVLIAEGQTSADSVELNYTWTNSAGETVGQEAQLSNVGPDIYQVMVSDGICSVTSTLAVTEPEPIEVVSLEVLESTCADNGNGEATIIVDGGTGGSYTYDWSHDSSVDTPTAIGLSSGDYTVSISDGNGCTLSETFSIAAVNPIDIAVETTPISDGNNGTITVTVTGGTAMNGYRYVWFDPNNERVGNERDSSLTRLSLAGEYMLMVEDFNGCTAMATIALENAEGCLEARTVITPNQDGRNENFIIRCAESYKDTRLEIYSRWGHLVYAQDAYLNDWEGRSNDGEVVPDGVYFYVLIYTDFDGEERQAQGTITVLTE